MISIRNPKVETSFTSEEEVGGQWFDLIDEITISDVRLVILFTNFLSLNVRFALVWLFLKFDWGCICLVLCFYLKCRAGNGVCGRVSSYG